MNCWMGYTNGPPGGENYKSFRKTSDIAGGLTPTDAFVFMEERAESIDDGSFETQMGPVNRTVANWPTDYHDGAATVAFADGHAEAHRWRTSISSVVGWGFLQPQQAIVPQKWGIAMVLPGSSAQDLQWLQAHASCLP